MPVRSPSISEELAFLREQTGEDEAALLSRAVHLGLTLLYRETVEQGFVDETLQREEAVAALGEARVAELEYARRALAQDVKRGLER